MTPQSIPDLSAALEEVIAEIERMQEQLRMSSKILRAVKLKLIETEQARKNAEITLDTYLANQLRQGRAIR